MTLPALYQFVAAHWFSIAVFLVSALPSVIVGVSNHPRTASALNVVLQMLSILTHRDVSGTFKLPLTVSQAPAGELVELPPPPRGHARIGTLALVAFAAAFLAIIGSARADTVVDPAPSPSQFGGCVSSGKVCFAPSVAISIASINLRTKTVEGAFSPGVGYGVTVNPGKWSSLGVDALFILSPAANQATLSVLAKFLNGYLRVGYSKGVIGDTTPRILLGPGVDIP